MPSIDISKIQKKNSPLKEKPETGVFDFLSRDISFGKGKLSDKKKEGFYNELGTLIRSGIDIRSALELTTGSYTQKKDVELFSSVQKQVIEGKSLSETMQAESKFSPYEYYSIKIGEETGKLGEVLGELAKYYKSKISQQRKIIGAITYPLLVLFTSFGAVFFMIKFVVPMFADVFLRFGGKLPWITALIIRFSGWFDSYFLWLFLFVVAMVVLVLFQRKSDWFRNFSSRLLLKVPIVGDLLRKIYLARFANTMRLLVSTDTPLLRSIALVRQMINYYPIETSLLKVEQDILQGESLHKSLAAFDFYPAKLIQLIKVGEEVNRMDYFFEKIAAQYTEEVEYKTNTISSLMEPLIIIFLGLVVGVILIAMYLPMFQMSNSF